jgi:hypothetical protein
MVLDPSVVAALVAALGALLAYLLGQRQAALERKRRACAEAIADALSWFNLPYRIRRRLSNEPETLNALNERINSLRERLEFHEMWLRVEVPKAHPHFHQLVLAVRQASRSAIEEAWESAPIRTASQMNTGGLSMNREPVEKEAEAFSSAVVRQLTWWRVLG